MRRRIAAVQESNRVDNAEIYDVENWENGSKYGRPSSNHHARFGNRLSDDKIAYQNNGSGKDQAELPQPLVKLDMAVASQTRLHSKEYEPSQETGAVEMEKHRDR